MLAPNSAHNLSSDSNRLKRRDGRRIVDELAILHIELRRLSRVLLERSMLISSTMEGGGLQKNARTDRSMYAPLYVNDVENTALGEFDAPNTPCTYTCSAGSTHDAHEGQV